MKELLSELISEILTNVTKENIFNLIEIPPNEEMGDYSFPCFTLAKSMKKSPIKISEEIKESFEKKNNTIITRLSTDNGYLNIFVNKEFLINKVMQSAIGTLFM